MLLKFTIKDFLDDREFKNLSKATLAGYRMTLHEFHDYCVEAGAVDVVDVTPTRDKKKNPARKVQTVKADLQIDVFTDAHIRQMLSYFQRIRTREKTFYAFRDYAIIVVLLGTGLRLGELVNLRWDDVDLHNLSGQPL